VHSESTFPRTGGQKTVLIFNFFGGILKRGIPHYVENLCFALTSEGIGAKQLRCPKILRQLPRPLLNCACVVAEQVITPIAGMWFDRVIYPSNSVSLVGALSRKTAVIFHDFISSRGRNKSMAAHYFKVTQAAYAKGSGDVIYISRSTQRIGTRLKKFPRSRTFLFPNSFYRLMNVVSAKPPARGDAVLLCSGWGKNKDLAGALEIYFESGLYRNRPLRILGLAGRREMVDRFERAHPEIRGRIDLMPEVDDQQVVRAYEQACWTWVHSQSEGFGRSIAEARICGSRVVASNIPPFKEQADDATFLYRGLDDFERAVLRCESAGVEGSRRMPTEHDALQAEIRRFINCLM
jgi:glycosyltransferase involved in cell wall biosynthesis